MVSKEGAVVKWRALLGIRNIISVAMRRVPPSTASQPSKIRGTPGHPLSMTSRANRGIPFQDRREAGRFLAENLREYRGRSEAIVLGLPRGGVPVAFEVARSLGLPMDVFMVRKLGVPGFEELAMGAIASGRVRVLNQSVLDRLSHPEEALAAVTAQETRELARREAEYRGGKPPPKLRNRIVLLVDDGLATGATMRAAVQAVRHAKVSRCVVAVPVASPAICAEFRDDVDESRLRAYAGRFSRRWGSFTWISRTHLGCGSACTHGRWQHNNPTLTRTATIQTAGKPWPGGAHSFTPGADFNAQLVLRPPFPCRPLGVGQDHPSLPALRGLPQNESLFP